MGTKLAKKLSGMSLQTKIGIVFMLVVASFFYQGILKPLIGDTATKTYYFTTSAAVNVGTDGTTSTAATLGGKISMGTGVYATSRSVSANTALTTEQRMISAYGPVYSAANGTQTLTAPAVTIGVRDRSGRGNNVYWKAYVYDYNPTVAPGTISNVGAANNATLLWASDEKEEHGTVQTPLELTFTNPVPKDVVAGHRLKVVITCRMAVAGSSPRLYWGNSTNYSFFTVTEANYVADSMTVTNLSDYYGGQLTTVTQGDSNIPMLQFSLYSNKSGGASWTGGLIDKIGTNTSVYQSTDDTGDASFSIYLDADGDGLFENTDTLVGGPYTFGPTGFANPTQSYTLTTPQTIDMTPKRYFVVYNISKYATYNTTVGMRIASNSYFTAPLATGGITNVTSTSSSTPNIQFGGTAVTKNYPADWDKGFSLTGIKETGGPAATDSDCIVRNTNVSPGELPLPLVGMLNYPAHSCTSVAGQGYTNNTGSAQADFVRLYFGGTGFPSIMKTIKGGSFVYRVYTPVGGGTATLQLFYVTSAGVRVNAPISSKYITGNSVSQTVTTSLAGQNFSNVPAGARLGIQIGVTSGMRIGLGKANGTIGSSAGSFLSVQETAAENENVDVANGTTIGNVNVYATDTNKVINSFSLTASKAKVVTSITVKGSAMFNSTNVKAVRIYSDSASVGTLGVRDATDTLIGSTSTITGNSATISTGSLAVTAKVTRYLVEVDIGDTPNTNVVLTALVSDLTVQTLGALGENSDSASGSLTILPTTTLSNGTAEPAAQIIPWNAAATKVDAFNLKTNGGVNDTMTSVTVTLTTASSLPAGKVISDYVGRVDIVTGAGASLGHLTAPTMNDNWQVPTVGLAATTTGTDYYVAITPKGNQNITFTVKAFVTAVAHSRLTNRLLLSDPTSATITLDQLPPTEPSLTAVTGAYGADVDLAQINLSWTGSTDASGSGVTYKLVRGLGNAPPPRNCVTDGFKSILVYQGSALSYINKGLDEGVSYGYRVCAIDSVNNITAGSAKNTTASIKNRCSELPELTIDPMASYVKAGNSVAMTVGVVNKDTGVCPATTFTLSIMGSNADDSNLSPGTFTGNNFIIDTNRASAYTTLNFTAKPGAVEGAMKSVHVKVTKSTGGETQCPDPVYVKVSKYGKMMHSSMQIGTARYGSWGLDYECSTCHTPNSPNIKQVKNVIDTPNGNRPVAFSTVSTASGASVPGVYGNDKRLGTVSSNVCEVCHHNARYHQYSTSKIAWKDHNNNTNCMKCHPHSIGFKSQGTAGSCDDCHGNPPTTEAMLVVPPTNVLFPYATNAGSHAKHNARQLNCKACHSNGNHIDSASPVGDKKLNMGFKVNNTNFTGFVGNFSSGTLRALPPGNNFAWQKAAGLDLQQAPNTIMTCNVYCHGWEGGGGYNNEPAWTGITQVGCGSCHNAAGDVPPTSGSHHKHASTEPGFGNGIACSKCHGFRNYSTSSAHINGNVEWDLSTLPPVSAGLARYKGSDTGSTGNRAPADTSSYGTCTNLYCHSNVQTYNGATKTNGPATIFNPTPKWGGTTNCGSCHAEPNTTGSHTLHVATGGIDFDCRICHSNGGDANPLNHANGQINLAFSGLGENTHYSYSSAKTPGSAGYGTCYNSNCHGSRRPKNSADPTALVWGTGTATPLCDKCHTTKPSAAGFYGTAGPASSTSKTDLYVGAHFQHITSMPYKYSGKIDCSGCHLKPTGPYTPGHIDSALPAELNFNDLAKSGVQNGYTSAAHQPGYNYGTRQCNNVWCHGAGMNSNEGTGPYGSVGPTKDGGTLGSPAPAIWNSPFLTGVGTNDCVKCHAFPPPALESGYTHWDEDNNRPYIANQCVLCHKHVDNTGYGFTNPVKHVNGVVDSCNVCHGRPPINEASLVVPAVGALRNENSVGAHLGHSINPNIGNKCDVCHYNYSQEMPSYKMEIGFNAFGGRVSRGTFYGYSTLAANYPPNNTNLVYFSTRSSTTVRRTLNKDLVNTCANLYCHGGGTGTLAVLGGGTNIKPNWEAGSTQAECGSCHGVNGTTYRARKSHGAHVGTGFGEPNLACANCHGIKTNNYHVNGKVEWEFYTTAKRLNQTAGYSGTGYKPAGASSFTNSGDTGKLAPSTAYGTCQVYCHSDIYDKTFKVPTWGGAAMTCDSCHRNQTSAGRFTGNHQKHAASSDNGGFGIECTICHYGSGSGNPLHVNGTVDIIFNPGIVGASGVYVPGATEGTGTCKNILCHVSDVSSGPTWGTTDGNYTNGTYKPTCIGCHSGELNTREAIIPQFAGESHHVQGVTISNSYCYPCHMEANADGTTNATYHDRTANKTVDLVIWGAGARGAVFTKYTANGSASRKRTEYAKINNVCIGCHRTRNDATTPFSTIGDNSTPKKYAWDAASIYNRYSSGTTLGTDTTPWGKVTGNNTVGKSMDKAYSAHGKATINERGWTMTADTFSSNVATSNVLCFDCHNSHGTDASGIMSSYSSATGRYKGGILKSTTAGLGGYSADYVPVEGGSSAAPDNNAYNPGAALCFNCHNNKTANTDIPWGYNSTFGFSQAIYGYNDKPFFGNYSTFASTVTSQYKKNNPDNKGGHFGPSSPLTTAVSSRNFANGQHDKPYSVGTSSPINGLCTPCHDPHGVSRNTTYVSTRAFGVPLLKGTWVTSPYKQDVAPANTNEARGGGRRKGAISVGSTPKYNIDQNTMGTAAGSTAWTFPGTPTTQQSTTDTQFAGLCTGCHAKAAINSAANATAANWKTVGRIHNTVKGWATATGGNANNSKHAFTCSKCHAPHNSRLPRLSVTNCLDAKHRGRVASGGNTANNGTNAAAGNTQSNGSSGAGAGRFPMGGGGTGSQPLGTAGQWFFGKEVESTTIGSTTQTLCHQSTTAGGATYNTYTSQKWNKKTQW
ncbi:CxxxxCH/CxxCH domain c-type cytochrome [Pelotalea chapellei]|uniref:CxxxxCH/CxxCH domain-containing protein n=1 Tax=Pelotalea chapellei TaxID=44671 RepID=A0ABS5UA37_9BACT|nr:CxxxxCH/CxxCH domain-containing protein [Pelotalea chapellei]MBT1072496.1 CxxxxCH/CxxCH domain-containing protein [Pelotalea chapellei]